MPEKESGEQFLAGNQLRVAILNLIRNYGQESELSVYTCIGVLEIVKADLIEGLERIEEK